MTTKSRAFSRRKLSNNYVGTAALGCPVERSSTRSVPIHLGTEYRVLGTYPEIQSPHRTRTSVEALATHLWLLPACKIQNSQSSKFVRIREARRFERARLSAAPIRSITWKSGPSGPRHADTMKNRASAPAGTERNWEGHGFSRADKAPLTGTGLQPLRSINKTQSGCPTLPAFCAGGWGF